MPRLNYQHVEPASVPCIAYHLACFTAAELTKPKTKREPMGAFLDLHTTEPWDTVRAQLLAKISSIFEPQTLSYDYYTVTFTIPRYSKDPLPLVTPEDHKFMMDRTLKSKDAVVNIKIIGNRPEAEQVSP